MPKSLIYTFGCLTLFGMYMLTKNPVYLAAQLIMLFLQIAETFGEDK